VHKRFEVKEYLVKAKRRTREGAESGEYTHRARAQEDGVQRGNRRANVHSR